MKKSVVFWGPQNSGKTHNANICSLLFNETAVLEARAVEFKAENYDLKTRLWTDLVIVEECFEEDQILKLELLIRNAFISKTIAVVYTFQTEKIPIGLDANKFHLIKCSYDKAPEDIGLPQELNLI